MSRRIERRWRLALGALAAVGAVAVAEPGASPHTAVAQAPAATLDATAAERARTLDALFKGLKDARGDDEADLLVARIWEVWTHFGREDVDQIMKEGMGFLSVSQLGAAHESFTKAIEAAPGFAEAWNKRATVRFLMHDHDRSLADIERVMALEPRHFGALAGRGMIHAQAGRWKQALEAYSDALAVTPFLKERQTVIPELERRAGEKPL